MNLTPSAFEAKSLTKMARSNSQSDIIIIGAGASGLFCAVQAAQRGHKAMILERQDRPGLKILVSGGGRCNFTNLYVSPADYASQNPHFCKSALARYTAADFIEIINENKIPYHEKHRGQLFCDRSSKDILKILVTQCKKEGVQLKTGIKIDSIKKKDDLFFVHCADHVYGARKLVIATGGLSYQNLGATDFGYRIAKQFGHQIIPCQPALTPILWNKTFTKQWAPLAGISCPVKITCGNICKEDDLLFTHSGLSGPVILRLTLHWHEGDPFFIDFLPNIALAPLWLKAKQIGSKALPKTKLAAHLPKRLAEKLCHFEKMQQPLNQVAVQDIHNFTDKLHHYPISSARLEGFHKAEVTQGGIDTKKISSQTMESLLCQGLYFIGEVLDVTGDLGGFNFQWAWASAYAAAQDF